MTSTLGDTADAYPPSVPLKTIRYLGNKRRILPFVLGAFENVQEDRPIIDLFAGTNVVAAALAPRFRVITNDVQRFSWILSDALLVHADITRTSGEAEAELAGEYQANMAVLEQMFRSPFEMEDAFLDSPVEGENVGAYSSFCQRYPFFSRDQGSEPDGYDPAFLRLFSGTSISRYKKDPTKQPHLLFSTYFANAYFGVRQAAEIDSIRSAIDRISRRRGPIRHLYLAALIYAASACVSSVGHFAQYRKPHSLRAAQEIARERKKGIWRVFLSLVDELFSKPRVAEKGAVAYNGDYDTLLRTVATWPHRSRPGAIYADPPYTQDHYSRYYHVLETLAAYDYPESRGIGRYRDNRSTSGFSRGTLAEAEFQKLASSSRELGSPLVVSYCNDGIVAPERLASILRLEYRSVETRALEHSHSNQGRPTEDCTKRSSQRTEYLFECQP